MRQPGRKMSLGHLGSDDGVTIVELLIALTLVMVTFAALAGTVLASFSAIRGNETRVRATAIANETIEDMASMPWGDLGLYEDDDDLEPKLEGGGVAEGGFFESEMLALFKDPTDLPAHEFQPDTADVAGRTYTVERWVTFVEEDGALLKRMIVIVRWGGETGGERSLRVERLRAPDPDDLQTLQVRFVELVSNNSDPTRVELNADFTNADEIRAVIEVGELDATVSLEFDDRGGTTRRLTTIPSEDGFTVTREFVIAPNAFTFGHGPQLFTVISESPDGRFASNVASIRFFQDLEIAATDVLQGDPSVSVDALPVCRAGADDYFIDGDVTISADVSGLTPAEGGRSMPNEPDLPALRMEWDDADFPLPYEDATRTVDGGIFEFFPIEDGAIGVDFGQTQVVFTINAARVIDQDGIPEVEEFIAPVTLAVDIDLDWPEGSPGDEEYDAAIAAIPACS